MGDYTSPVQYCRDAGGGWLNRVEDKESSVNWYAYYYIIRCLRMLRVRGLPDTMPEDKVKHLILTAGGALVIRDSRGDFWATGGSWGGEKDQYYFPAQFTVSNPYIPQELCRTWDLREERWRSDADRCVHVKNDLFAAGLMPIIMRWCRMLAETDISLRIAAITTRASLLLHATNEDTRQSAEDYIRRIIAGELSVIGDSREILLDGIEGSEGLHVQPGNEAQAHIQELIELHQYVKAGLYNELGLQSQYNLKRERLTSDETSLNEDTLFPLVEHILESWRAGFDRVNEIFGTEISVELAGPWEQNKIEADAELAAVEQQADAGDQSEDASDGPQPTGDRDDIDAEREADKDDNA